MKEKRNTIILIALLAVLIVGSVVAYRYLLANRSQEAVPLPTYSDDTPETSAPKDTTESQSPESSEPTETSRKLAPIIKFYSDKDTSFLLSDFYGKPTVINFWASWCPPCKQEMPYFQTVFDELGDEVNFIMLDLVDGGAETLETGSAYIAEEGYSFPVFYDLDGEGSYAYNVTSIPATYFLDSSGHLITGMRGTINEETLRDGIKMAVEASEGAENTLTITQNKAKAMMDEYPDAIVLDVRTQEEYDSGHLPNSQLIPLDQLAEAAAQSLPDKDARILIYCRSGNRSLQAAQLLANIGYTNVYDFGGINDWPYDVVTE